MALIGPSVVRRIILSLIAADQERRIRAGTLDSAYLITARVQAMDPDALAQVTVDEPDLGYDSLARLDLVSDLTRWFDLAKTGVEDYLLVQRRLGDWVDLIAWHLTQVGSELRLTFSSSGSTGTPKHMAHSAAALVSEIEAHLAGPLANTPLRRVLGQVHPHHIYGFLWTGLLPHRAGWDVCDLAPGLASAVARKARSGDLIVATPFGWDQMAQHGRRLPEGVIGLSSGGPSRPETWNAAQTLGLDRLIEIYGSSETGGVGWRDRAEDPFTLVGDLVWRDTVLHRGGLALDLQDRLEWESPDRFRVLGRKDPVVQVAGTNVNLADLRQGLLQNTPALDAAFRLETTRLKAFVVLPDPEQDADQTIIRQYFKALPAPAQPARLDFGAALPRTAMGKAADW